MPTTEISQSLLAELQTFIEEACARGDTVKAISERSGCRIEMVYMLKKGTYESSPSLEKFESICAAIGKKVVIKNIR